MGQALYRKSRPLKFSEVVGQEHVTKTLERAIKSGRISHAYLFTGPRGVGKTSVARILAHEVNELSYDGETVHLDIIEIDGASNRRIDEIRDLRDKAHVLPAAAKYKVYIIDEVHMLTREAFNALLKTLEEPPAHCIFILATTEYHKLPETIVSRTQRFSFKPVDNKRAADHLSDLAKKERIEIDRSALELLAEHGDGSFRDSIGLLDQLSGSTETVTEETVRQMLGLPPATSVEQLLKALNEADNKAVLGALEELREQGVAPATVARQLAARLRQELAEGRGEAWLTDLLRKLIEVPASSRPQDYLEIALLEAAQHGSGEEAKQPPPPAALTTGKNPSIKTKPSAAAKLSKPVAAGDGQFRLGDWPKVVERSKTEAASIYTALRLAEPRIEETQLVLAFQFPLHQKKVAQAKNTDLVARLVEEVSGCRLNIKCVIDKQLKRTPEDGLPAKPVSKTNEPIKAISNIFGSAEVLES